MHVWLIEESEQSSVNDLRMQSKDLGAYTGLRVVTCNEEHVRDHQQQTLRGRERRGQAARDQTTVHSSSGTGLGLHRPHEGHGSVPVEPMCLCKPEGC